VKGAALCGASGGDRLDLVGGQHLAADCPVSAFDLVHLDPGYTTHVLALDGDQPAATRRRRISLPQRREVVTFNVQQEWLNIFGADLTNAYGIDEFTLTMTTN